MFRLAFCTSRCPHTTRLRSFFPPFFHIHRKIPGFLLIQRQTESEETMKICITWKCLFLGLNKPKKLFFVLSENAFTRIRHNYGFDFSISPRGQWIHRNGFRLLSYYLQFPFFPAHGRVHSNCNSVELKSITFVAKPFPYSRIDYPKVPIIISPFENFWTLIFFAADILKRSLLIKTCRKTFPL